MSKDKSVKITVSPKNGEQHFYIFEEGSAVSLTDVGEVYLMNCDEVHLDAGLPNTVSAVMATSVLQQAKARIAELEAGFEKQHGNAEHRRQRIAELEAEVRAAADQRDRALAAREDYANRLGTALLESDKDKQRILNLQATLAIISNAVTRARGV